MKFGCLVAAALLLSGCGYENPVAPRTSDGPRAGVPSRIELSANPGSGTEGGTGTITARVFDGLSEALRDQTVTFTATGGTLAASEVVTDEKGYARTSITGPEGSFQIVAAIGTIETKALIAIQPLPTAPPPPSSTPPPPPPPTPPQPPSPPPPNYVVTVSASPASVLIGGSATLTATAIAASGAPTTPSSYAWDCDGNGTIETTTTVATTICVYPTEGTIASRVSVSGGTATGSASTNVAATKPTITVACDSPTLVMGTARATCVVNAKLGSDPMPSTTVTAISFDWGDSTTSSVAGTNSEQHDYMTAVTFPIIATATVSGVTGIVGNGSVIVKPEI
jgi:hypothetical protein